MSGKWFGGVLCTRPTTACRIFATRGIGHGLSFIPRLFVVSGLSGAYGLFLFVSVGVTARLYERTAVASACLVRSSLARPPLRHVGRETWWTLPCASCRVPSTRGVFSRTLLWKTGALALSSSFTRGKGRYGHLGVDAGFICTSGPFPYRSSFLPARSTHLRPFGRVTRQTFPSALGLGTVCLALVPLALPLLR